MTILRYKLLLGGLVVLMVSAHAGASQNEANLVRNGDFAAAGGQTLPAGWSAWRPVWQEASCTARHVDGGLLVDAPGRPYAVGGLWQDLQGLQPGKAYAVEVVCEVQDMPFPFRSVYVRWTWSRQGKYVHPAGMFVRRPHEKGTSQLPDSPPPAGTLLDKRGDSRETLTFSDVFVAPEGADAARLSLEIKWPGGGSVCWRRASVRLTAPPAPRKVKIGTVYLRPRNSTPQKNLDLFCRQIDAAGELGLDVVCLGEAITMVGTSKDVNDVAEPIPGPSTRQLARAARSNKLWVVAGLTERDGDLVYNTAVLINRHGGLAGKYRKVHLPREEWKQGITPGRGYPVFQTDFGTVAIQICYDWFFPEPHTIFGLHGAEIVFAPTWGNTLPDDQQGRIHGETVFRVRARDNGVYLVPSVYDGSSMVIDPMGRILASNKGREGVFWAEVDLNRREPLRWVGHWRSIGPRHRMPNTYGPLTEQ